MTQQFTPGSALNQQPLTLQIIDVGRDPALKSALLSGRLTNLTAPFMYHDPAKQLALILMPMGIGLTDLEQQRIIGQLTQAAMRGLPEDAPRAYLLQPRIFFSMQSLIEAILEADGISPETLREQQARADLLRDLLRTADREVLLEKIRRNDAQIDELFFELLSATIENTLAAGNERVAQALAGLQSLLLEETTYGRKVKARVDALEAFRKSPTRETLLEQLIQAPDSQTRETLIALGRPLLDYLFFQQLTTRVDNAKDDAERERLIALRKEIQEIRDKLDAASRALLEAKAALIEQIATSPNPVQTAREHAEEIDEALLSLLEGNLQAAQQRNDQEALRALNAAYEAVMQVIAERQPPELQMINMLLAANYPDETEKLLREFSEVADDRLITLMAQVADQLAQQERTDLSAKLTRIMVQAREILPRYTPPNKGSVAGDDKPPQKPIIEIARR